MFQKMNALLLCLKKYILKLWIQNLIKDNAQTYLLIILLSNSFLVKRKKI
jgi:hypothetical protein